MQTDINQKVKVVTGHFTDLSSHAEKLAFPNYRKGIFAQKDLTGWNVISKYIYNFSHPFAAGEIDSSLFFILWLFVYIIQYLAFMIGLVLLYPILFNQTPFLPPTNGESQFILWLLVIVGIPSGLITYSWWIDTLLSKKNPWWVKVGLISMVWFMLSTVINAMFVQSPSTTLVKTSGDTFSLVVAFGVLLIPSTSYAVAILFDFFLSVLLLIRIIFGGVRSVHAPRPVEITLKLATEEIPANNPGGSSWKLYELPKKEVVVLHQWAEANREGSEKRTLPAFFVATLIGVILASDFLRNIVDGIFVWLSTNAFSIFDARTISIISFRTPVFFVIVLLLMFSSYVLKSVMALFRNIVAQNLIIEACIIAEHLMPDSEHSEITRKRSFLDLVFTIFKK